MRYDETWSRAMVECEQQERLETRHSVKTKIVVLVNKINFTVE